MTDRPIIFSNPMVLALLDGRKTMTRRLAWKTEPCPQSACPFEPRRNHAYPDKTCESCPRHHKSGAGEPSPWQRVQPGDRLWVRESLKRVGEPHHGWSYAAGGSMVSLPRSDPRVSAMIAWAHHKEGDSAPSIHMPRWASRLTLIVTATKIERLQEITNGDCIAEGPEIETIGWDNQPMVRIDGKSYHHQTVRLWYHRLWDSLHGDGAWDENPEVVALTFTVHKQNIDALAKEAA